MHVPEDSISQTVHIKNGRSNCLHCGISFHGRNGGKPQRYCSRRCSQRFRYSPERQRIYHVRHRSKTRKPFNPPKNCQFCGSIIILRTSTGNPKKSCSVKCRRVHAQRIWRSKNGESYRKIGRESYKRCRVARCIDVANRILRKRGVIALTKSNELKVITKWWKRIKALAQVKCYWCTRSIKGKQATQDHIIAINNGGMHSLANLCVSCSTCNSSKRASSLSSWNQRLTSPALAL